MTHYTDYPNYPTKLLNLTDYPTSVDDVVWVEAWLVNALRDEMMAVQKELGTLPKANAADLTTRLSVSLQADGSLKPSALWASVPTYPTSAGEPDQIAYDTDYFYACYDTDSWHRAQLTGW